MWAVYETTGKFVAEYYVDTPSFDIVVRQLVLYKVYLVFQLLLLGRDSLTT